MWSSFHFQQQALHNTGLMSLQPALPLEAAVSLPSKPDLTFLPPCLLSHPFFPLNLDYLPKQPCACLCQHPRRCAAQNRKSSLERAASFFQLQYWFTVTGEGWPQPDTTGSHFGLLRVSPVFHPLSARQHAPSFSPEFMCQLQL